MITSQRKIGEQILLRLRKYTDESSIDVRELILAVHQSLSTLVRNRYFEGKQSETGEIDGSLFYTINNIEVKDDGTNYYIETPSSAIALPFGIDISRVWANGGSGYIEVPLQFLDMYKNRASMMLAGNIGYYRVGLYLHFVNMTSFNKPKELNVTLLLPFSKLDDDDSINIPSDMLDEAIEMVFMKYAKTLQIPIDNINDTNDN